MTKKGPFVRPDYTEVDLPTPTYRFSARLSSFPSTHDIDEHPYFKGHISRWAWRFYTHRLTSAGRWFFWPTVLFTLWGSVSFEFQYVIIFLYIFILWAVALILALCLPPRVTVRARHAGRIRVGETLPIELTLTQQGHFPGIDLQVLPARLPLGLGAIPQDGVPAPMLKRGETANLRLGLYAARRGVYALKGYRVESDFPFGLYNAYRFFPAPAHLLVYPKFTPIHALSLPRGRQYHPGGLVVKSSLGDSFELLGNREYREGDSIRNIDWRATARLQTPILREYSQEFFLRVGVVLDTFLPGKAKAPVYENFERAVSLCAAISDYMARQAYLVDIFAAGSHLYRLTTGANMTYLDEILDILACVEGAPREPFNTLQPEISQELGKISLLICILLDWDQVRQQFVEQMSLRGVAVKVVIVRDSPCTLDPHAGPWLAGTPIIGSAAFAAGVEVL
jgi:uncharacterized protein (DUF58 family)